MEKLLFVEEIEEFNFIYNYFLIKFLEFYLTCPIFLKVVFNVIGYC